MRTSIDLADGLLREAKIEAVRRGVTLKELLRVALDKELHGSNGAAEPRKRLDFPLIKSNGPPLRITAEDIKRIELESDLRGTGIDL